jgi:hypothetical protein
MDPLKALFENAWRRFTTRFWILVWIFVAPAVLIVAGELFSANGGTGTMGIVPTSTTAGAASTGAAVTGGILSLIGTILSVMATVAIINALARGTNVAASYRVGLKLFWPALWISILNIVALIGGFVLLIVPGLILTFSLIFAVYVLVVEDKRGMQALEQSRKYVKGYWWAVVGRMVLVGLIFFAAILIIYMPMLLLLGTATGGVVYFVLLVCFTAFSAAYSYEMYENLRRLSAGRAGGVSAAGGAIAPGEAAKAKSKLLSVCLTVGVIVIALILLFALIGGFSHA